MANSKRYLVADTLRQMNPLLQLDLGRVLRRAGLAQDFLDNEGRGVTAHDYFALWDAVHEELGGATAVLDVARKLAGAPIIPAMLAFSSSPDTQTGLARLALFKPLVGPIRLQVKQLRETVTIEIASVEEEEAPMPVSVAAFELVFFIESMRRFTGVSITPLAVELPADAARFAEYEAFFGVSAQAARITRITLSLKDARRPLISQNAEFWAWLEVDLTRQLAERDAQAAIADRVRAVLIDLLPAGDASADAVCRQLGLSKRSLQRKLSAEGESFQSVLDATRSMLAMRYLHKGSMSVEEISYLLAYQDPNSFYRAFQGWTGMTPAAARSQALQ